MKKKTGKSLDILKNIRNFAPFSGMRGSQEFLIPLNGAKTFEMKEKW